MKTLQRRRMTLTASNWLRRVIGSGCCRVRSYHSLRWLLLRPASTAPPSANSPASTTRLLLSTVPFSSAPCRTALSPFRPPTPPLITFSGITCRRLHPATYHHAKGCLVWSATFTIRTSPISSTRYVGDQRGLQHLIGAFYTYDDLYERPNEVSFEGIYGPAAVPVDDRYVRQLAAE